MSKHRLVNSRKFAVCLAGSVFVLTFSSPLMAGCQSGNWSDFTTTHTLAESPCQGYAYGYYALAVGGAIDNEIHTGAFGDYSTALGMAAYTSGAYATAVGYLSGYVGGFVVERTGVTTVGAHAGRIGSGDYSTAIGGSNSTNTSVRTTGTYSIAIGGGDGVQFTPAYPDVVIPLNGARATGFISTAIGTAAEASGGGSMAIGLGARSTANDSVAIGEFSTGGGARSVALGLASTVTTTDAFAAGYNSKVTGANAVAIGANSIASAVNSVSVGAPGNRRRIMNVAPGKAASDAVNLSQLQAAVASVSALSAESVASKDEVEALRREVAELRGVVAQLRK